jgi:hypothetical protein
MYRENIFSGKMRYREASAAAANKDILLFSVSNQLVQ